MGEIVDGVTPLTAANANQFLRAHASDQGVAYAGGYFIPGAAPTTDYCIGISSIVKNGTGDYWITYDGSFTMILAAHAGINATVTNGGLFKARVYSHTTTRVKIGIYDSSGVVTDDAAVTAVHFSIFGID